LLRLLPDEADAEHDLSGDLDQGLRENMFEGEREEEK
jgi:hypothetical protein